MYRISSGTAAGALIILVCWVYQASKSTKDKKGVVKLQLGSMPYIPWILRSWNERSLPPWLWWSNSRHLPARIVLVCKSRISTSRRTIVPSLSVQLPGSLPTLKWERPPTITISLFPLSLVTRLQVCPHRGVVICGPTVHTREVRFKKAVSAYTLPFWGTFQIWYLENLLKTGFSPH